MVAGEIGRERLHRGVGRTQVDGLHAGGVVGGAAVRQVVAIHRGEHHVLQPHQRYRVGHLGRLQRIEPAVRVAGGDRAEPAGARAHRAHQHQRGGAAAPALGDVGALGFGAYGVELVRAHDVGHFLVTRAAGQLHAQPWRLATDVGLMAVRIGLLAALDRTRALRTGELAAVRDGRVAGHEDAGWLDCRQCRAPRMRPP